MVEGTQGANTASVDNTVRNHLLGVDRSFFVDVAGTGVEAIFESPVARVVLVLAVDEIPESATACIAGRSRRS